MLDNVDLLLDFNNGLHDNVDFNNALLNNLDLLPILTMDCLIIWTYFSILTMDCLIIWTYFRF